MEKIIVTNVEKSYDRHVLGPCSFVVEEGKTLAIMGPSGSGKSTLIKGCAGLIEVDGQFEIRDLKRLVMVFDEASLIDVLNAKDNIALGMKKEGYSDSQINSRMTEIAKKLKIEELLEKRPSELSYGQRQRVALARALIRDFDVLLMDEPFSGLDVLLRKEILLMLKQMQMQQGFTCLYVTHDVSDAKVFSDQVLVLKEGKMEVLDTIEECIHRPVNAFVQAFFE